MLYYVSLVSLYSNLLLCIPNREGEGCLLAGSSTIRTPRDPLLSISLYLLRPYICFFSSNALFLH